MRDGHPLAACLDDLELVPASQVPIAPQRARLVTSGNNLKFKAPRPQPATEEDPLCFPRLLAIVSNKRDMDTWSYTKFVWDTHTMPTWVADLSTCLNVPFLTRL